MRRANQVALTYILIFILGFLVSKFIPIAQNSIWTSKKSAAEKQIPVKTIPKTISKKEADVDYDYDVRSQERKDINAKKIKPVEKPELKEKPDILDDPNIEVVQISDVLEPQSNSDPYFHLTFEECRRLPKDRNRKVTVPPASTELRQEIAKLKIKTFLPKVNFRKPKLLFFAGLEGTGHHLIDGCFKDVCTMVSETVASKCRAATNIIPDFIGNIGFKWDFRKLSENSSQHPEFLRRIKEQAKLSREVMFLNSMRHHSNIFLDSAVSYPDGGHPRIDNFPDVRFLAEILDSRYLDFNIILMLRDIDSLLVSTVLHRAFEPNFYNQAHIFEFMLEMLVSQLEKLDPKFIIGCIKLDSSPHIMRSNLKIIDEKVNSTFINFEEHIMKSWNSKSKPACIHPDDLNPKLMYRLVVLNQRLHSFCPS